MPAIAAAPQPVIAGINGVAAGAGASLAIAADLRIASEDASIGFTFNRIGLHPDWGASHHLPRLVGSGLAADLLLTARMVDAAEALRIGLVDRVVTRAEFGSALERLAAEVSTRAPVALRRTKRALRDLDGLERALGTEREAQAECFASADVREGLAAFREKRPPRFQGR